MRDVIRPYQIREFPDYKLIGEFETFRQALTRACTIAENSGNVPCLLDAEIWDVSRPTRPKVVATFSTVGERHD